MGKCTECEALRAGLKATKIELQRVQVLKHRHFYNWEVASNSVEDLEAEIERLKDKLAARGAEVALLKLENKAETPGSE